MTINSAEAVEEALPQPTHPHLPNDKQFIDITAKHLFHMVISGPCVSAGATITKAVQGNTLETPHPLATEGVCPYCDAARILLKGRQYD